MQLDARILTGQTDSHVVSWRNTSILVHAEMVADLESLSADAEASGFEFAIASGYRSFSRQLEIWNAKAQGKRPLLDAKGAPLKFQDLSANEILHAILRWSALPGTSRHHWGTDLDVYDRRAMPSGYQIQLVTSEFEGNGLFAPFHNWLDDHLAKYGFFRPYAEERGGVRPERWHLSYRKLAEPYLEALTLKTIEEAIAAAPILLKAEILQALPTIYARYVQNISRR